MFKAHRLVYHSTLGLRVIKKKKKKGPAQNTTGNEITPLPRIPGEATFKIADVWRVSGAMTQQLT